MCIWLYSGTSLIRSLNGPKKNGRIEEGFFFYTKMCGGFCQATKKKWPYQRGDRKEGFHCIFHVGDVSATEFGAKNKPSEIAKIFWMTKKDKIRIS